MVPISSLVRVLPMSGMSMKAPARPPHELERLAELHRLGILDTPAEQSFDEIAALAAHICGTPISAVTLIDERRQWIKAAIGIERGETTREESFCGHTILSDALTEVEDAHADERFVDNPFVVGSPNVRFYAGAPLVTGNGHALGALCVIDEVPRQLTAEQRRMLAVLGRQVVAQIELRRQNQLLLEVDRARKQAQARLQLLHELSGAIAGADDVVGALSISVARLCEVMGWQAGGAWLPDAADAHLRCAIPYFVSSTGFEALADISAKIALARGDSLPGRAWQAGEPVWIEELSMLTAFPRAKVAASAGLHTGLAIPVHAGNEVVAVLDFFSTERRSRDEEMVVLGSAVAAELGAVVRRKRAEDALRDSELRFRSLSETAPDAIVSADHTGVITDWNPAATRLFGHAREHAIGKPVSIIVPERLQSAHTDGMHRAVANDHSRLAGRITELVAKRADGAEVAIELSLATWRTPRGRFFSAIMRDITERKAIEAQLRASEALMRHQATHDELTAVANRRHVLDALTRELARASRDRTRVAVVLADVDFFKRINDRHGHAVGDEVLREAALRMTKAVRPYDCVGRYGGEEFLVVLPGCDDASGAAVAERLRASFGATPFATQAGPLPVTCSFGLALSGAITDARVLIAAADAALYRAKSLGRDRVELATPDAELSHAS